MTTIARLPKRSKPRVERSKPERQTMTPEQARTFSRVSEANYLAVKMALTCTCEPYQDTFTFGRWIAQGYCVCKGQHGHKIAVKYPSATEVVETEDGELVAEHASSSAKWGTAVVFCRCQVTPLTNS